MCRVTLIVSYMEILAILSITSKLVSAFSHRAKAGTIGYDCGSQIQNLTTISLIDIDDCDAETEQPNISSEDVVLLQLNKYKHLEVIQCKIEITRIVSNCGMFSHNSNINHAQYIRAITRDACEIAHNHGTLKINNEVLENLKVNATAVRSIMMAGSVLSDGTCKPAAFSDPYGFWAEVIAIGSAKITLRTAIVRVDVDSGNIHLPSGFRCKLSLEQCIDSDGGYTFWKSVPKSSCTDKTYSKLYEGNAIKFESNQEKIYSVNANETSFSLKITGVINSCGAKLYQTESSKLFLMKQKDFKYMERPEVVDMHTDNLDIFQYINAKFVYVERHIRSQMNSLYRDVVKHQCKLEKEILKNTLAIASTQPDEFAFRYMGSPGYMAVLAGEVIHIVQCVPVEVKLDHVDKCYNRLPVLKGNVSMFLTPRTRIITQYAAEIPCNRLLQEHYNLQGTWYRLMPRPISVEAPVSLKPSTKMRWRYQNLGNLAKNGIYQQKDLERMSERIMRTVEQIVVLETVAHQFTKGMKGPVSVNNLFSDDIKQQIAESIWSKSWGKFIGFGTTCAGFIGIFLCFSLLRTVADCIFNGYALYKVFGWSFSLVGACWNTVANILLAKGTKKGKQTAANLSATTLNLGEHLDLKKGTDQEIGIQNSAYDTLRVPTPSPRRKQFQ